MKLNFCKGGVLPLSGRMEDNDNYGSADVMRVGIVGFGFMGRMHYACWRRLPDARIVAVCDVNPGVFEKGTDGVGNIEGATDDVDFAALEIYSDFDKMLSSANLEAVSITLPTYLHTDFSIKALEAGVNVLCEKPMALNAADCDRMIETAQKSGMVLQIGHCMRFWPEYVEAERIVSGGAYGAVTAATFQRLCARPRWAWDGWAVDQSRSGGMMLDLHIHDTDFVQHLFGIPRAVRSFTAGESGRAPTHVVTHYLYGGEKVVTAEGSWAAMPSFGFEMSFNILLERASLVYDCTREPALRVCPAEGEAFEPELPGEDGYFYEIEHFAKKVKGESVEEVITLRQSRNSVRIVEAEKESAAMDRKIAIE